MKFSKPNVDYADLLRLSPHATKPAIARVGGVCMVGDMIFGLPEGDACWAVIPTGDHVPLLFAPHGAS
jgi:hypothetical protein